MSYIAIDEVLFPWADSHALHVYTEHQDEEVRSIDIVSGSGRKVQIWVDALDAGGTVTVHVWDYRKRRKDRATKLAHLEEALDGALWTARNWLNAPATP